MQIRLCVRLGDLVVIDLGEPVVCCDGAGVGKDKSADRIGNGRVLLDAPVGSLDIGVNELFVVKHGGLHIAELFALTAVKDVRLCNILVASLSQDRLNAVLNVLYRHKIVFHLRLEGCCYLKGNEINYTRIILTLAGVKCKCYRGAYL